MQHHKLISAIAILSFAGAAHGAADAVWNGRSSN